MAELVFFNLTLLAKNVVARDILELKFDKPQGFSYDAGQFVQFKVQDGEKHVLRSYSLSSVPSDDYLEFCVKILPDGKASQFFSDLSVGETAQISAARGMFVCQHTHSTEKVFVATGAGIAPIMGMIRERLLEISLARQAARASRVVAALNRFFANAPAISPPKENIKLIFGVREEADLIWHDRLSSMARQLAEFEFLPTLSRPSDAWLGKRGRVTEYVPVNKKADYYICGSLEMVKDVRKMLLDAGVDAKKIHFEIF